MWLKCGYMLRLTLKSIFHQPPFDLSKSVAVLVLFFPVQAIVKMVVSCQRGFSNSTQHHYHQHMHDWANFNKSTLFVPCTSSYSL